MYCENEEGMNAALQHVPHLKGQTCKESTMQIRIIVPLATAEFDSEVISEYGAYATDTTDISVVHIDEGPSSIMSEDEEGLAVRGVLHRVEEAARDKCDAIICDCFADPGVSAAREMVDIPVIGPGQASMLLLAALGQDFSVVTAMPSADVLVRTVVLRAGLEGKLRSIRSVNIPVLDMCDKGRLLTALSSESSRAVHRDNAHVVVLGCTGMSGVASQLNRELRADGLNITVLDPVWAAVKLAETLVSMQTPMSRMA